MYNHGFTPYICLVGLLLQLVLDNGPEFISAEFNQFLKENGVRHVKCTLYHPSSNGLAEGFVCAFKQSMKVGEKSGNFLQQRLDNSLLRYRTTPHATMQYNPASLILRRDLCTHMDLLKPNCEEQVTIHQDAQTRS